MENLKVLNVDVNAVDEKINLNLTEALVNLSFDNTQVKTVDFEDVTVTKNMASQLEPKMIDLSNEYLDEIYDVDFNHRYNVIDKLYNLLVDHRDFDLCEIEDFAKELLENEIKEAAKNFLVGVLETINDGEESLANHFRERKDGGYYLELNMFFRTDIRQVMAEFDSCSLAEGTYYPIGEVVIEFDVEGID